MSTPDEDLDRILHALPLSRVDLSDAVVRVRARVAELEAREKRIRDAAFHPLFNSVEARATIRTILNLAPNA